MNVCVLVRVAHTVWSHSCLRRSDKGKTRENVRNKRTKKLLSSWTLSPGSRFGFVIIMRATHYTFTWDLETSPTKISFLRGPNKPQDDKGNKSVEFASKKTKPNTKQFHLPD